MISHGPRCNTATGRKFWNKQAYRFTRSFYGAPTTNLYFEEEKRLFRRYFPDIKGRKLLKLDLWNEAQNTQILFWAARQGGECYAVDIAEATAQKARDRSLEAMVSIQIAIGDVSYLPFSNDSFDYLYTMGTLEHIPDPSTAFDEIARVLKPGGVAIVGVPNIYDPFLFSIASRILQSLGKYPYGYERWFTNRQLKCFLENAGLRTPQQDGILFLPWFLRFLDAYLWQKHPWGCRITSLFVKPFRLLTRIQWLSRKCGYLTICVAEKEILSADLHPKMRGPAEALERV